MAFEQRTNDKGEKIVDANGLPVRAATFTPQGSVLPTVFGGWNNEFNYKNFSFSFLIDYNFGNSILSATSYYSTLRGLNQKTLVGREGGITEGVLASGAANTVAASAQNYYGAQANNITASHVLDGDFIKLRQMSIGYNLPASALKPLKFVAGVSIALVGRNLLVLHKKSDNIDPEATFGSNVQYFGIEGTSLPTTRSYGVNVNIRFKN
jgi:hypothetical protein